MTISKSAPTVLYIDDRPTLLELRKATLESHGLSIETVLSESAAMRLLEGTSVDAVLLEYKQEGMDREAIAYHIRQRFPNLPIVLISAYFEMPERILWLVDEYVLKSEIPEGLVRAIERVTRPSNADKAHRLAPRSNEPVPVEPAA
jgi:CheY-like chemotaxis protein